MFATTKYRIEAKTTEMIKLVPSNLSVESDKWVIKKAIKMEVNAQARRFGGSQLQRYFKSWTNDRYDAT
jgi:hypothetical protein